MPKPPPKPKWGPWAHAHPTPETDHIDRVLNALECGTRIPPEKIARKSKPNPQ